MVMLGTGRNSYRRLIWATFRKSGPGATCGYFTRALFSNIASYSEGLFYRITPGRPGGEGRDVGAPATPMGASWRARLNDKSPIPEGTGSAASAVGESPPACNRRASVLFIMFVSPSGHPRFERCAILPQIPLTLRTLHHAEVDDHIVGGKPRRVG
jgi:hypothetical protein